MKDEMRKVLTIVAAMLATVLLTMPAIAQQTGGDGAGQEQGAKKLPPSGAVKRALRSVPGAEALGVKLKGDTYIVKLKQDGSVVQVGVNAFTGEVFFLQ
jgi:uncharacterized membrane protein YkoI